MYARGSSAVACGAVRYVTASTNVGPSPLRARSTASRVASYTASTSVAAPPRQHGLRRHPAQETDCRLAVGREDPVAVLECVRRAGLHRLVVPEDGVRADGSLPVVDD